MTMPSVSKRRSAGATSWRSSACDATILFGLMNLITLLAPIPARSKVPPANATEAVGSLPVFSDASKKCRHVAQTILGRMIPYSGGPLPKKPRSESLRAGGMWKLS